MKNNILILLALLLFAACQKQPTANFNADKSTYYAGETVHLTDASTNAHHWLWTLPDGTTSTNQNVDFVIDSNDIGGDKTFSLTVTSKNGNKLSTISKIVSVSQPIIGSDFVSDGFGNLKLYTKKSENLNGISHFSCFGTDGNYLEGLMADIYIGEQLGTISSGTYPINSSLNKVTTGNASIKITSNPDYADQRNYAYSKWGTLNVAVSNHQVHLSFNHISAFEGYIGGDTTYYHLTGDLIFNQ